MNTKGGGDVTVVVPTGPGREARVARVKAAVRGQTASDRVSAVLCEYFPEPAIGRNRGWREATTPWVWFLDDDMVPAPECLAALLGLADEGCDLVEGHIHGGIDRIVDWGFMTGNILYRRSLLERIGGMDEDFHRWREDTDLAWRAIEAGARFAYAPSARACHPESSATGFIEESEERLKRRHPVLYELCIHRGRSIHEAVGHLAPATPGGTR